MNKTAKKFGMLMANLEFSRLLAFLFFLYSFSVQAQTTAEQAAQQNQQIIQRLASSVIPKIKELLQPPQGSGKTALVQ